MSAPGELRNLSTLNERGERVTEPVVARMGVLEQRPSIYDVALAHALAGRALLPLAYDGSPLVERSAASRDPATLRAWFDRDDAPSVGMLVGRQHGVLALEVDLRTPDGIRAATALRMATAALDVPGDTAVFLLDARGPVPSGTLPNGVHLASDNEVVPLPPSVLKTKRGAGRVAWRNLARIRQLSQSTACRVTAGENRRDW